MIIESDYLHCVFDPTELEDKLDEAELYLSMKPRFDIIVCRGVSGLVFAPILAYRMKKGLAVVRKGDDSSHSCMDFEGCIPSGSDRWMIVDDFVSSGHTLAAILKKVQRFDRLAGAYLYKVCGKKRFFTSEHLIEIYKRFFASEVNVYDISSLGL